MHFDLQKARNYYANRPTTFYDPLGLPYEGKVVPLKNQDSERNKPQKRLRAHAAVFESWNPEHLELYGLIKQWIGRGWGILGKEYKQVVPEQGGWLIFMRWCDCYCQLLSDADYIQMTIPNQSGLGADSEEQPILDFHMHTKVFKTVEVSQLLEYEDIWQTLINGSGVTKLDSEEVAFSVKDNCWLILLQWREHFLRKPGPDGR